MSSLNNREGVPSPEDQDEIIQAHQTTPLILQTAAMHYSSLSTNVIETFVADGLVMHPDLPGYLTCKSCRNKKRMHYQFQSADQLQLHPTKSPHRSIVSNADDGDVSNPFDANPPLPATSSRPQSDLARGSAEQAACDSGKQASSSTQSGALNECTRGVLEELVEFMENFCDVLSSYNSNEDYRKDFLLRISHPPEEYGFANHVTMLGASWRDVIDALETDDSGKCLFRGELVDTSKVLGAMAQLVKQFLEIYLVDNRRVTIVGILAFNSRCIDNGSLARIVLYEKVYCHGMLFVKILLTIANAQRYRRPTRAQLLAEPADSQLAKRARAENLTKFM